MQRKAPRFMSLLTVAILALGFASAFPAPTHALPTVNPAPVQFFYVTLPEPDALTVLDAVNGAANSPTYTYFSIAIGVDGTYVYYDQMENGYDTDIANPTDLYNAVTNPDGTQVWGNGEADDGCAPNLSGTPVTCTDGNDVLNSGDVVVPYNAVPVPLPPVLGNAYVLDTFSTVSYSNNDGTANWAGSWTERGTGNSSPSTGRITITGGQLRFTNNDGGDAIDRGVTMETDCTATLSFVLGQSGIDNSGDNLSVRVSDDGGSNYTVLDTFTGSASAGSKSYNISGYAASNTRVQFYSENDLENNEYWSVDDARVDYSCPVLFNGKDKVAASKSIAMARAVWASGSDTLNAFGHEMYATAEWGTAYESPVGTNTGSAGQMFELSRLSIMASQNGTTVQVDADANGSYETTVPLNEGGAYLTGNISQGARVQADKPVQVLLVTGDVGSNYGSRDMNLLPTSAYGTGYWSPVGKNTGGFEYTPAAPVRLFLYNPSTNGPIYITCERRGVANVTLGPVAARGVATVDLVDDQGARCFASDSGGTATSQHIFAIGTMDTTGTAGDWSFTLYPDDFLTTDALVGLGLGRDPTYTGGLENQNGSPLWVTAACTAGSTYVYVDWNNDGTPDKVDLNGDGDTSDTVDGIDESTSNSGMSITRLQSARLYNPTVDTAPYDQTGARIWSRTASGVGTGGTPGCNLALAWGQDPGRASASRPGLDVGTTIPPLRLIEGTKSLTLKTDNDGDGLLSPGDVATYNITVKNSGPTTVNNVYVYDTVPVNTTYNANTTEKDVTTNAGTSWVSIPDNTGFPLDAPGGVLLGNLPSNWTFFVRFDVTLNPGDYEEITNCETTITAAGELTRCATNQVASRDWGDLPDSYGTSLAANGPRHSPSGIRLGTLFDREYQGQPSVGADGDDLAQSDDEDGVLLDGWLANNTTRVDVTVTGGSACLNGWMDFSNGTVVGGDGDFGDSLGGYSEHVIVNATVPLGSSKVTFGVPTGVGSTGNVGPYYLRFRLSPLPCGTINSTGPVTGGEVEDYRFTYPETPLSVVLADLSVVCQGATPVIGWETVSELTNQGFNLFRSEDPNAVGAQLNGSLIPSQGPGSAQGFVYSWPDTTAATGVQYYYWLEDVDFSGATHLNGPVSGMCQAPTAVDLTGMSAEAEGSALPLGVVAALAAAGLLAGLAWRRSTHAA